MTAATTTGTVQMPGYSLLERPGIRVSILIAGISVTAVGIWAGAIRGLPRVQGPFVLQWWFLAPIFLITEGFPVHVHFRRETHSLSLSDLALVLALFLAPPSHLLVAQLVGCGAAVIVVRRQRPLKVAFNLAQFGFTGCLAILVFRGILGGSSAYGIAGWSGALAGAAVAAIAGIGLVALAILLTDGGAHLRELPFVAVVGVTSAVTGASLGLAALELLRADREAIWLLAIPVAMCLIAFHAYSRQRRRRQHLEFLYSSMRTMQAVPNLEAAAREVLCAARAMVSAEHAELILLPRAEGDPALRSVIAGNDERLLEPIELSAAAELALRGATLSENAILLPRGRQPLVLDAYLTELGLADAVVSAIRGEAGVTGMLLLGDRSGDVATFSVDDRKLVETFANHAGVLLENDQVRERLRHQAFHDALTDLPNRVLFTAKVGEALERSRPGAGPAVLFLDLDDFKTVNDSLGHSVGDELLVAVARRVRDRAGDRGLAARLGGDEFGILLREATLDEAEALAADLLDALREAVTLAGREITIHPSIGIAAADQPGMTAEEILRNADVAMYSAKSNGKRGCAVYQPEMHARARHRQELASALERAVERDEIRVRYQPIIDLATGDVVAFEALARWQHPDHGLLAPGSFIPLAEETGIATAIGRIVRREAAGQLVQWRAAYPGSPLMWVSANLSPTELQNPHLVDDVVALLAETGLGSENLVLEITESSALKDPDVTIERLRELRQLGVRVALDDFGTGYSYLSHLRDLPIDFVKIAKPFVDGLVGSPTAESFVQAITHIAKALELTVIAEGIEEAEQARIVGSLDCGLAQGYLYSRPLEPGAAEAYLRSTMQQGWQAARERRRAVPAVRSIKALGR